MQSPAKEVGSIEAPYHTRISLAEQSTNTICSVCNAAHGHLTKFLRLEQLPKQLDHYSSTSSNNRDQRIDRSDSFDSSDTSLSLGGGVEDSGEILFDTRQVISDFLIELSRDDINPYDESINHSTSSRRSDGFTAAAVGSTVTPQDVHNENRECNRLTNGHDIYSIHKEVANSHNNKAMKLDGAKKPRAKMRTQSKIRKKIKSKEQPKTDMKK